MLMQKNIQVALIEPSKSFSESIEAKLKLFGAQVIVFSSFNQAIECLTLGRAPQTFIGRAEASLNETVSRLRSFHAFIQQGLCIFLSQAKPQDHRVLYHEGTAGFVPEAFDSGFLLELLRKSQLDLNQLWNHPSQIEASHSIVTDLRRRDLLKFGRGGFCLQIKNCEKFKVNQVIDFDIKSPDFNLLGSGRMKWQDSDEIGIEFIHLEPSGADKVINTIQALNDASYIPSTSKLDN